VSGGRTGGPARTPAAPAEPSGEGSPLVHRGRGRRQTARSMAGRQRSAGGVRGGHGHRPACMARALWVFVAMWAWSGGGAGFPASGPLSGVLRVLAAERAWPGAGVRPLHPVHSGRFSDSAAFAAVS